MGVYTDVVQTRFDMLTGSAESGLESLMQNLGLVESRAIRARKQLIALNNSLGSGKDSVFGKILDPSNAQKQMAELNKMPGSQSWAKNYMDGIYKSVAEVKPEAIKMPTQNELFKGLTESFSDSSMSRMDRFAQNLAQLESQGMDVSKAFKGVAEIYGKNSTQMREFESSMVRARKEMKLMQIHGNQMKKMGLMFGMLFGGMQVQRFGQSMLRFMIPAMDKLEGYTSKGTKQVNAMKAAFEFLKFSMFEAITTSFLFDKFVQFLIIGTNWVSKFVSNHPTLTAIFAGFAAFATAVGTLMVGAGFLVQLSMLKDSIKAIMINSDKASTNISNMGSTWSKVVGAGLVALGTFQFVSSLASKTPATFGQILSASLMTGLGAGLLFNPVTGVITGLVIAAVMTIDSIDKSRLQDNAREASDMFQASINKAFKSDVMWGNNKFYAEANSVAFKMGTDYVDEFRAAVRKKQMGGFLDEAEYRREVSRILGVVYRETADPKYIKEINLDKSFENVSMDDLDVIKAPQTIWEMALGDKAMGYDLTQYQNEVVTAVKEVSEQGQLAINGDTDSMKSSFVDFTTATDTLLTSTRDKIETTFQDRTMNVTIKYKEEGKPKNDYFGDGFGAKDKGGSSSQYTGSITG